MRSFEELSGRGQGPRPGNSSVHPPSGLFAALLRGSLAPGLSQGPAGRCMSRVAFNKFFELASE